jgi:hypothetical protein
VIEDVVLSTQCTSMVWGYFDERQRQRSTVTLWRQFEGVWHQLRNHQILQVTGLVERGKQVVDELDTQRAAEAEKRSSSVFAGESDEEN